MNPEVTLRKFPVSPEEIEAAIAAAPEQAEDLECPYDPNDAGQVEAYWQNATVVRNGGYPAVQSALAERRGLRSPQIAPLKVPVTIRFDEDVLAALRATGKDWQTRVNVVVREWLESQRTAGAGLK